MQLHIPKTSFFYYYNPAFSLLSLKELIHNSFWLFGTTTTNLYCVACIFKKGHGIREKKLDTNIGTMFLHKVCNTERKFLIYISTLSIYFIKIRNIITTLTNQYP